MLTPARGSAAKGTDPTRRGTNEGSRSADRRSFADRWGAEIEEYGFTQTPWLLRQHAKDLALHPVDLCVIAVIEAHDWTTNRDGVFPSVATIARQSGCGDSAAKKSRNRLERAGLIEVTARERPNGWQTSNGYTWNGLRQALTLIAGNRRSGRDPIEGLPALLNELAEKGRRAFSLRRARADRSSESDHEVEQTYRNDNPSPLIDNPPVVRGRNPTSPGSGQTP
jgi:hypothetical protein